MPSPPPTPFFWFYLILHLFLHPFTVSSGRAQGGPALAAFWARVREATGSSSSGAAAAAAFFIAALDAFAARGKACITAQGLVLVFYLFFDFFSGEFYGTVSVLCFTDFILFSCTFYASFSAEFYVFTY